MIRTFRQTGILLAVLLTFAWSGMPQDEKGDSIPHDAAAQVAVQEGGRVKPLGTVAHFALLQLSGRSTCRTADREVLSSLEWLIGLWRDPELTDTYPVFLIESAEAMDAIGLAHTAPRMRFSYAQLFPLKNAIGARVQQWAQVDETLRTPAQTQVLRLAQNLSLYESLRHFGAVFMAEAAWPESWRTESNDVYTGFSYLLAALETRTWEEARNEAPALTAVYTRLGHMADALAIFPPEPGQDTWLTPADLIAMAQVNGQRVQPYAGLVAEFERALLKPREASGAFLPFNSEVRAKTPDSRELRQIPREVWLYKLSPFYYSLVLYVLAFLVATLAWVMPRRRWLHVVAFCLLTAPWLLHVYGIVLRCMIRGRPPVTTLYETLLFVTAVAAGVALLCELLVRRRIALVLGALLGATGLFLANRYAAVDGRDTMPSLIAVLNTNFWLATHVTSVTIGYAAGLLAGAMAHLYLLGNALGFKRHTPAVYRPLTRMVYGLLCFSLVFATIGTILGGIWANESWGRFWGWDPKENGALMIVLWELAIVHARQGGLIRAVGIHMAAVFGNIIIVFAWFGVNLLGVGLHSYGFTSGIQQAISYFYALEMVVLLAGGIAWLRTQRIIVVENPRAGDSGVEG